MLLSLILAWLTVIFAVLAAFKFIARKSGNKKLNRVSHNCHIPFGILMIITGLLHGILAGNPSSATLGDFTPGAVLFTLNWGTVCLVLGICLGLTYIFRKGLGRKWMPAHRVLTVLLIACIFLHVLDMGIQLPSALSGGSDTASGAQTYVTSTTDTSTSDTADTSGTATTSDASGTTDAASSSGGAVTFSGAQLADGTYEGSADGYKGTITVSVTVSGGQVTDIQVVSESDSQQFFSRAEAVLDDILGQQSLEVDTVSGATFSSAGLINAVYNALQGAVTSGTLQVTSIDLSSVSRQH